MLFIGNRKGREARGLTFAPRALFGHFIGDIGAGTDQETPHAGVDLLESLLQTLLPGCTGVSFMAKLHRAQ